MPEVDPETLELAAQAGIGDFAPFLVDHRTTALRPPR
jgi:hypothetical protein